MEQLSIYDWMPEACPGTTEYDEYVKNQSIVNKANKMREKLTTYNEEVIRKNSANPELYNGAVNKENWYALLAAILSPKVYDEDGNVKKDAKGQEVYAINSADDAFHAMGLTRDQSRGDVMAS